MEKVSPASSTWGSQRLSHIRGKSRSLSVWLWWNYHTVGRRETQIGIKYAESVCATVIREEETEQREKENKPPAKGLEETNRGRIEEQCRSETLNRLGEKENWRCSMLGAVLAHSSGGLTLQSSLHPSFSGCMKWKRTAMILTADFIVEHH